MTKLVELSLAHKVLLLKHYQSEFELLFCEVLAKVGKHELHEGPDCKTPKPQNPKVIY